MCAGNRPTAPVNCTKPRFFVGILAPLLVGKIARADFHGKTALSGQTGTESGTLAAEIGPELAEIVEAWPALPGDVKADVMAAVRGGTL